MASNEYRVGPLEGDALRLFTSSRMLAIALAPYLATGMFRLHPLAAPGLGTIAVDRWWRLYVDPMVFSSWSLPKRALSLLHEVSHLLRDHAQRCDDLAAEHKIFNVAADAEINDDLDRFEPAPNSNIQYEGVPDDWIVPGRLQPAAKENLLAEVYYRHLIENNSELPGRGSYPLPAARARSDAGRSGVGRPPRDLPHSAGRIAGAQASPGGATDQAGGGREQLGGYGDGTCGSGAGGGGRPWEIPQDDERAPGVDRATADLVRRQVAQATVVHAKTRGSVPGGLLRWAESALEEPKVPWRRVLAGAVKRAIAHRAGQVDYSYQRPGRRRVPMVLMPAMRRPIPSIAVVVDTSGSMSTDDMRAALGEVKGISSQVGIRGRQLRLLQVDAAVHSIEPVFDVHKIDCRGGGGTDMVVGIRAAEDLSPRPDAIVVLTDGETPWPAHPVGMHLVIGIIGTQATIDRAILNTPRWATVIGIESDTLSADHLANVSTSAC